MNKKIIIKAIIMLLIFNVFLILANTKVQANASSDISSLDISIDSVIESAEEENIVCYDAATGKTTEVDIEELKQVLTSTYGENYTSASTKDLLTSESFSLDSYKLDSVTPYASTLYPVSNPTTSPYSAICKITCDGGDATGFLVRNNKLLTAGHCVINQKTKQPYGNWTCYPAYNNGPYKGYSAGWSKIYYDKRWLDNNNAAYDWCLCILGTNLGQYVDVCIVEEGADATFTNASVKSIGYARDYYDRKYQCYSSGKIIEIEPDCFKINYVLSHGMSGGPTMRNSNNHVVGINAAIYKDNSGSLIVRITESLFSLILS